MSSPAATALRSREFFREAAVVLSVVLAVNALMHYAPLRQQVPQLHAAQLRVHQALTAMLPRHPSARLTAVAEIGDDDHPELGEPTNRAKIAAMVRNAVDAGAEVVVLDIKLLRRRTSRTTGLTADDMALIDSVRDAIDAGVPVVLSTWLEEVGEGNFQHRPNIFDDASLSMRDHAGHCSERHVDATRVRPGRKPSCVGLGNINVPVDKRKIPIVTPVAGEAQPSRSLPLETIVAYEESARLQDRVLDEPIVIRSMRTGTFPFGTFMREESFLRISALALANGDKNAISRCRGKILLIGGTWHADLGHGSATDLYPTPVGPMPGVLLMANYIEALADRRFARELPIWVMWTFDALVGILLYVGFHFLSPRAQLVLLLVPGALLIASYLVFAAVGYYLDFIIPLSGCFAHLGVEHVRRHRALVGKSGPPTTAPVRLSLRVVALALTVSLALAVLTLTAPDSPTGPEGGGVATVVIETRTSGRRYRPVVRRRVSGLSSCAPLASINAPPPRACNHTG